MKVNAIRCLWKLAGWQDLENKWFAGGGRPLERKRIQEQRPSQQWQHLDGHNHLPAAQMLKPQGRVKPAVQAVSHGGEQYDAHVHLYLLPCCFTWTCIKTNKQNKRNKNKLCSKTCGRVPAKGTIKKNKTPFFNTLIPHYDFRMNLT